MKTQDKRVAALEKELRETREKLAAQEHQLVQAQLEVEEANRLKTEFLARMSHDLRTPMNAIIGYARILMRKLEGAIEPRQVQNIENIQTSANHLLDLINDILDLSKVEAGRIEIHCEEVNVKRLVGECLAAVSPLVKEGVELHQNFGDIDVLHTDSDRLRRALINLLSNAVKYTREGRITVAVEAKENLVEVTVCDTGDGIPTEELPFIFDEFRQVARKGQIALEGTGLGLAIVRRSAQLLGGGVRVESCEGEGTTFTLVLPHVHSSLK